MGLIRSFECDVTDVIRFFSMKLGAFLQIELRMLIDATAHAFLRSVSSVVFLVIVASAILERTRWEEDLPAGKSLLEKRLRTARLKRSFHSYIGP